mgnify:CR=1 FL=1
MINDEGRRLWRTDPTFSLSSPINIAPITSAATATQWCARRISIGWRKTGRVSERFYVATPICMPNRATLMTGRMPSLHGARQNGIPLSLTATTFVDIMRAAGYNTALIGKCHLQSINGNPPVVGMPEADADRRPAAGRAQRSRQFLEPARPLRPGAAVHLGARAQLRAVAPLLRL